MSVVASSPQQICMSPLNTSMSKQLYSFPKMDRFKSPKQQMCDSFYDLPSTIEKRAPGMGYGTKLDFFLLKSKSPPPNAYNLKSDIETSMEKKQGWSMAIGRDHILASRIVKSSTKGIPGPGQYPLNSSLSQMSFTLRSRTKNFMENTTTLKYPGPGSYNHESFKSLNESGKYNNSKYKNSCATTINPAHSQRFVEIGKSNRLNLGPGSYTPKDKLNQNGKYFLSTQSSSRCRLFGKEKRKDVAQINGVPGPGSYRLPSDFGHYESSKKK